MLNEGAGRPQSAHVIVLGNEKGGSGKSTVAMHIAVALMKAGQRVATIDLDSRQKSFTTTSKTAGPGRSAADSICPSRRIIASRAPRVFWSRTMRPPSSARLRRRSMPWSMPSISW